MRGKLPEMSFAAPAVEDHPRGCGENARKYYEAAKRLGSPPRMRGKRRLKLKIVPCCGITPADAGKTSQKPWVSAANEDHPRGCGENTKLKEFTLYQDGSPPRMRGKLYNCRCAMGTRRITPADAGKTP